MAKQRIIWLFVSMFFFTGCLSAGFLYEPEYNSKLQSFVDNHMTYYDVVDKYGPPSFTDENGGVLFARWDSYRGGGATLGNTSRGPLSGRRMYTSQQVDLRHGCSFNANFDSSTRTILSFKIGHCQ